MAIKIFCDICEKEALDPDFIFEATKLESVISLDGVNDLTAKKRMDKKMIQICRGCYFTHLSKLFNKDDKN
jgi:hypothetical protein